MKKVNYPVVGETRDFTNFVTIKNATNNEDYAEVPALSQDDIDVIYQHAKEAQKPWAKLTISQRATYLKAWGQLLLDNIDELAEIMTIEIAKSRKDAETEIKRTVEIIEYTIEEMYRLDINGASSEQYYGGNKQKMAITKHVPVGVVLAISPFNYPVNLAVAKIAPALISGNAVVFKPATQGSVVGIKLIELLYQTGIDKEVVSVVTGRGREIGDYLVERPEIDFISFTGGTTTGQRISKRASMVPQVMELGGKDAAIVMDDADLEFCAKEIVDGGFNYSAQRCTAIKRVLVSKKNVEELTELIVDKVNQLSVGMPEENPTIVPLISESSADYVEGLIASANSEDILCGNKREGNIIYPTVVKNVKRTDRLAIEEPFGPVLPIICYEDLAEAISIHNESEFGLQASIFGKDINAILNLVPELEVGTVNVNGKTSRGPDNLPFTGYKNSGMGVQGIKYSLLSMTKPKTTVINILK